MGFLGLGRKPKHLAADPKQREAAVRAMPVAEQGTLCEIALGDDHAGVRVAAAAKVIDVDLLQHLAKHKDAAVARVARDKLAAKLLDAVKGRSLANGRDLLNQVTEQSALVAISLQAEHKDMRDAAFERLAGMEDASQHLLTKVAIQEESGAYGQRILERIDQRSLLKDLSKKAKAEGLRTAAKARLESVVAEANKPSPEKRRKALQGELEALTEPAQGLALSQRWEEAESELQQLIARGQQLVQDFDDIEPNEASREVLAGLDRSLETFQRRKQEAAEARAAEAEHARAKEAMLAELAEQQLDEAAATAAQQRWAAIGLAGEQETELADRFRQLLAAVGAEADDDFVEAIEAPTNPAPVELDADTTAKVEALIAEAAALIDADGDWRDRDYRFKELDKDLRNLAGHAGSKHPLRVAFLDQYMAFKDKRRADREAADKVRDERLAQMRRLLAEAEQLGASAEENDKVDELAKAVKDIQQRWRAIGKVPAKALGDLRDRFRAACDQAYAPVKKRNEARDWERFARVPVAEELIDRAKALLDEADPEKRHLGVKDIQQEWKKIGRLPRERNDELWGAFKAACDAAYESLADWFAERDKEREMAQQQKEALLGELQGLIGAGTIGIAGSIADRESRSDREGRIKEIQAEWKAIGPAPRAVNQDLWNRYKELLDQFYAKKREEWAAKDQERLENLHRKQALCIEVEELAAALDQFNEGKQMGSKTHADFARDVKDLQRQFRQIGHVPRDQFEAVRDRFKVACDRIYDGLERWFDEQDGEREANYEAKEALLKQIEELLEEDRPDWFKDEAKEIQAKWREIGQVPRKKMDINDRFRAACDRIFNAPVGDVATTVADTSRSGPAEVAESATVSEQKAESVSTAADDAVESSTSADSDDGGVAARET